MTGPNLRRRLGVLEARVAGQARDDADLPRRRAALATEIKRIADSFAEADAAIFEDRRFAEMCPARHWAWSLRFDAEPQTYIGIRRAYARRSPGRYPAAWAAVTDDQIERRARRSADAQSAADCANGPNLGAVQVGSSDQPHQQTHRLAQ